MKNLLYLGIILILASCGSNESEKVSISEIDNPKDSIQVKDSPPVSSYQMHIDHSCSFDVDLIDTTVYSFTSDVQADKALNRIMKLTGLPANFELKSASVPNACAVVKCDDYGNCKRYILYSQEFMENIKYETRTNYAELGILAHEIGHHLSGHTLTNTGSRYDTELEADKFAGFMLYKLGATITEVKQCYSSLPSTGSSTHPPKSARIAAVSSGYYDAKRSGASVERTTSSSNTSSNNNSNSSNNPTESGSTNVIATVRIRQLELMTKDLGMMNWEDAKSACADLGDGWRLPTKDELNMMYENKDEIGGFANSNSYWSSTHSGGLSYWRLWLQNGLTYIGGKYVNYNVRAVRSI
jgi:hypothetical protein|tara:strand:+ start:109 stop:1173 length:1065 start_codon:yes stop_codon:yes gene_type:complete